MISGKDGLYWDYFAMPKTKCPIALSAGNRGITLPFQLFKSKNSISGMGMCVYMYMGMWAKQHLINMSYTLI